MRKTRLYLDTSVISDIDAPHVPDKEAVTREFFRIVTESDEYELFISPVTENELGRTAEPKRTVFRNFLESLEHTSLPTNREAMELANKYLEGAVLGEKHIDDLTHIAYAVVARCDYVISWNMHFVRERTITRVNAVNAAYNYPRVFITTPVIITGETTDEND